MTRTATPVELLLTNEVRAIELVHEALRRVDEDRWNAFVTVSAEVALHQAECIDDALAAGRDPGPLAGYILGVKDVHDVAGLKTMHGSKAFLGTAPSHGSSVVVERLRTAGAITIGKTVTSELEFSATSDNPITGRTEHPWLSGRTPGGSSAGSAVAVAAGLTDLATATDGGGSIRIPAAACGLPALKLSPGLVSAMDGWGLTNAWGDLSSPGVISRDLDLLWLAYDVLLGVDQSHPRSLQRAALMAHDGVRPRILWMPDLGWAAPTGEIAETCRKYVDLLSDAGAEVTELEGFMIDDPAPVWTRLASTGTIRWLERHPARPEISAISEPLASLLESWGRSYEEWERARKAADDLAAQYEDRMEDYDVLLSPTLVGPPPIHEHAYRAEWVKNTYFFNLVRAPAGTIPVGTTSEGFPVGLHLSARNGADRDLVRFMTWAITMSPEGYL